MSQGWKGQGSSFNSLVKSKRIVAIQEHAFQTYNLPDSTNSGITAQTSFAKLAFNNADSGVSATNQITFQGAVFGNDASATLVFTDASAALSWVGIRTDSGTKSSGQNILLTDTSGESLLLILDRTLPRIDPNTTIARDPSWSWAPGHFAGNIGCGTPPDPAGTDPGEGGTLGAVTIYMGIGNEDADARALQLARGIGDPSGEKYHWSNPTVWEDYPKLQIGAGVSSLDPSLCFVWQTVLPTEEDDALGMLNKPISYCPDPGSPTTTQAETFVTDYNAAAPNNWYPAGTDGSFNDGMASADISLNIVLQDTSGETLKVVLDVDLSLNSVDPSWNNVDASGSLGSIIIPMGTPYFDPSAVANNGYTYYYLPEADDRAQKFINAINDPSTALLEITADLGWDQGEVILTQDYGGAGGNTNIIFDPSFNDAFDPVYQNYPLDASYNKYDASFSPFTGGTDIQDLSQNIILKDVCNNEVLFRLNVDLSYNKTDGTRNWPYPITPTDPYYIPSDPSSIMVPMDGSGIRRITDVSRAIQFYYAVNWCDASASSTALWPRLYIYAGKTGGSFINSVPDASSVTLTQYYPGEWGNGSAAGAPFITYDPTKAALGTFDISRVPIFPFPDPSGYSGGIDPIDNSQNLVWFSNANFQNVTIFLNVDMPTVLDPSGPDASGSGISIHVPMGKGLGQTIEEIAESARTRAQKFKEATVKMDGSGFTFDTTYFPAGAKGAAEILAGVSWEGDGGLIYQAFSGINGNFDISFNPSPAWPSTTPNYDASGYPLKQNSSATIASNIFNSLRFGGGIDELAATDDHIRSQSGINIRGGKNITVTGDQSSNTITITSTQPDSAVAPIWTIGKGAGSGNSTIFSMQAINPSMDTGLFGAGANYAIAGGLETQALGVASVVFGKDNVTKADYSFAMGNNCTSEGIGSISMGENCIARENYSQAFGFTSVTGEHDNIFIRKTDEDGVPLRNNDKNVIFAIASPTTWQTSTAAPATKFHNIFELDVCGNLWTATLGSVSSQIVSWQRTDDSQKDTTGIYVDHITNIPAALGNRSIACGYGTKTYGNCSFIDGSGVLIGTADNGGDYSAAFGLTNTINNLGAHSFIAGKNNEINNASSACFGEENKCTGKNTFCSGFQCDASGDYSISMGVNNKSEGFYSVALGGANYAFGESSVALGRNCRAIGFISTTLGCHCEASGNFSVAIGRDCTVHHDASNSVALGYNNIVRGENSIALGTNSIADGSGSFAVLGGMAGTINSIAIGLDCSCNIKEGAMAFGNSNESTGLYSLAIGRTSKAEGDFSISIGDDHLSAGGSKGYGSITIGSQCVANDDFAIAIGSDASSSGVGSMAMGWECQANSFQDPSGWLPANSANATTETSIAFGRRGDTRLTAAWRGGITSGPGDYSDDNPAQFRKKNGGIIFAIGASGESYYPEIFSGSYPTTTSYVPPIYGPLHSTTQETVYGNIFEIYANGKIWTTNLNTLVPISDASSAKWVHPEHDSARALIKADSGNNEAAAFNLGNGAVCLGNNSSANGNYSIVAGYNSQTTVDASYSLVVGLDCSANFENCLVVGNTCFGGNDNSIALGIAGNSGASSSGGDISSNDLIFAIGVSGESYRGNIFEIDVSGSVWTKNLGTLASTIPALGAVPIGGIVPFAGTQSIHPPVNWLWCDGANGSGIDGSSSYLDHTINPEYESLFLTIGQTYGTGPGGVGFRVPMLEQRFPTGVSNFGSPTTIGNSVWPVTDPSDNPAWGSAVDISGADLKGVVDGSGNKPYEGFLMRYIIRYK